jgi:hypothetical protein
MIVYRRNFSTGKTAEIQSGKIYEKRLDGNSTKTCLKSEIGTHAQAALSAGVIDFLRKGCRSGDRLQWR